MKTPTVHLNGSSREALETQFRDVVSALQSLIEAMVEARPNGRDYYPQGDAAFQEAQVEHARRLTIASNLKREYEELWESVQP